MTAVADRAADVQAAPTSGARRVGTAIAMLLAPWGFVVANTAYALALRGGGNEETSLDTLALYAAHPDLVRVAVVAAMLGSVAIIPAVLGAFRLAPRSWLVLVGGSLMVVGYACYAAVALGSLSTLAMAQAGDPSTYAPVLDAAQGEVWGGVVFALFALGNLVGTLVLAIGLLRSRAVPAWAAIAIMCWPPLHVIGLVFFGNEVPQVIGAVLQAVGFAGCAYALMRARRGR